MIFKVCDIEQFVYRPYENDNVTYFKGNYI